LAHDDGMPVYASILTDPGRPQFTGAGVLCLLAIALVLLLLYMLARGWRNWRGGNDQRNR
jgi:hypothetical protein